MVPLLLREAPCYTGAMSPLAATLQATWRSGADIYGFHRVLEPQGVLPQAALRLDTSLPIFSNELLLEVSCLHLDSASFRQLQSEVGTDEKKLRERILEIVRIRGKMHNPVTGSGGMLTGKILQKGPDFPSDLPLGTEVATLVSLTLTPLYLERILRIDQERGQVWVQGYALLFASGLWQALPKDLSMVAALEIFDVCGVVAQIRRWVQPGDRVFILGLGRAGLLAAAWLCRWGHSTTLWGCDLLPEPLARAKRLEFFTGLLCADARRPLDFHRAWLQSVGEPFDLILNTCNVSDTEASALLALRPGGRVLYFNMATDFSRVVLSAEGMGKDAQIIFGQGFVPGHGEEALGVLRYFPRLKEFFEGKEPNV